MESLASVWSKLDGRRRAVVVLATLAVFGLVAMMARGPGPANTALLYAGLDAAAAGEVVAALDARGVPYEVRGDAIYVPESARDLERMALAAEGLPASGGEGYELLDSLSGFGTTSQMFDAAYWRAKEGELARTILAAPHVRTARVHISAGGSRPFRREDRATAAVTVTTRGGPLTGPQAQALRHLVAAAVPGLAPADVAVIDGEGGLVPDEDESSRPDSRAAELAARAERLLEARVGPGNAVVEVSIDAVTESEQISERRFDPEGRVAISTETSETETSSQGAAGGGAVTVASNLPDGDAAAGGGAGPTAAESESRTTTNYEVSETSRQVVRAPGAVRRLTVAVLVNEAAPAEAGAAEAGPAPRSEEELAALRELVEAAVGFDAERGDVITVKAMAFEGAGTLGSEPAEPLSGPPLDLMSLARPALLALVAIVLGLFVVRPILTRAPRGLPALPPPAPGGAVAGQMAGYAAALGGIAGASPGAAPAIAALAPPPVAGPPGEAAGSGDPVARLRRLIESRQDETAQILQSWIDDVPSPPPAPAPTAGLARGA